MEALKLVRNFLCCCIHEWRFFCKFYSCNGAFFPIWPAGIGIAVALAVVIIFILLGLCCCWLARQVEQHLPILVPTALLQSTGMLTYV